MGVVRWHLRQRQPLSTKLPIETKALSRPDNQPESLTDIEDEVRECQLCPLHRSRRKPVFGSGNSKATWLLVGEAPGAEEDRQGLPFVGRAGQLLTAMLRAVGMKRQEIYIANVLKCRPPQNRDPFGAEVQQCELYLHRQIALIQPRLIIAMGRFAAQSLLRSSESIGRLRGIVHQYRDTGIPLLVTYHPAYLLRQPSDKYKAWSDLKLALKVDTDKRQQ